MTSKAPYATLGVALTAAQDRIRRAYEQVTHRFHPDLGRESFAPTGSEALPAMQEQSAAGERQCQDTALAATPRNGKLAGPYPADWPSPFTAPHDPSMQRAFRDFFATTTEQWRVRGKDQHGVILIELAEAYCGVTRTLRLQIPAFDSHGALVFDDRQLDVVVPKGVLDGQRLRLQGLGAAGQGGAAAGDLYLEVVFIRHAPFRLDARDVHVHLPLAPWEAALGATVTLATPTGPVPLRIPPGSAAGRRLRLKGLGLPGSPPGDLYAALDIALPPGASAQAQQAWRALAHAFPDYHPRD